MERVLFCAELLSLIFSSEDIDDVTLSRCARVCTSWFASAAPILWRSLVDVEILFNLLPVVKRGVHDEIAYHVHSESDWARFNVYAKFVRSLELQLNTDEGYAELVHDLLSKLAYTGSTRCLLPNVDMLEIHYDDLNCFDCLFFINARLRHLEISDLCTPIGLYNTFKHILSKTPCITSLSLKTHFTINTLSYDDDFALAFGKFSVLEDLTLDGYKLTSVVLLTLSSIPCLKKFTYEASHIGPCDELDENFYDMAWALGTPFPQLEEITFTSPMANLSSFLSMKTPIPSIKKLEITIIHGASEDGLQTCSERIARYWSDLRELSITIRHLDASSSLKFDSFKSLSELQELRLFQMESLKPLYLTDEELNCMTRHWYHITYLYFVADKDAYCLLPPRLTLSSSVTITRNCPCIEGLILFVDASKSFRVPLGTSIMKKLKVVSFRNSPISDPDEVAYELSKVFNPSTIFMPGYGSALKVKVEDQRDTETLQRRLDGWLKMTQSLKLVFRVIEREHRAYKRLAGACILGVKLVHVEKYSNLAVFSD